MLDKLKKKDGFTLVELLVVIFIIGLLAAGGVFGYSQYRKSALLDLNADLLMSQVYQMREKTVSGVFGGERSSEIKEALESGEDLSDEIENNMKCFGVSFVKEEFEDGEAYRAQVFEEDFSGKKVYEGGKWVFEGCDEVTRESKEELEIDSEIYFEELGVFEEDGETDLVIESLDIVFEPPSGTATVFKDGDEVDKDNIQIILKYGVTATDEFKRKILLNLESLTYELKFL